MSGQTEAVPVTPAPPIPLYPQFAITAIPAKSGASNAYRGYIRPFSDDATAKRVLRAMLADQPLTVSEGRLNSDAEGLPISPIEDYLLDMAAPCTVIVLEFPDERHPRAYLVDPPLIPRVSANQHLRGDLTLVIEYRRTPALCVYSANLFKYDPAYERLPQFLNQLSTYLAKHLIYLRTRMLQRLLKDRTTKLVRLRKPGEPISLSSLNLVKSYVWSGLWIGSAPGSSAAHLRTVDPSGECWCTSGKLYKSCCMRDDLTRAGRDSPRFGYLTPLQPPLPLLLR